jgi:hypothetical protein
MSIHRKEKLNVFEGNACNYSHPTWRPTSCTMATKVLQIASWVLVSSFCHEHNIKGGSP